MGSSAVAFITERRSVFPLRCVESIVARSVTLNEKGMHRRESVQSTLVLAGVIPKTRRRNALVEENFRSTKRTIRLRDQSRQLFKRPTTICSFIERSS